VIVGTYSSIFVAAPIVLWWSKVRGKSLRREVIENTVAPVQSPS
jgi:preprotein translocase subunit SecF